MTDGSRKQIGACLEVFGHESAVAGAHAAHFLTVYVGMCIHEGLCGLNDVVGRTFTPRVDVARCEFFTVTNGAGGFKCEHHITHVGQDGERIMEL